MEIRVKYEGYIQRQQKQVEEFRRMESHRLPPGLDYASIQGLRLEAREKLSAVQPLDLGQAAREPGRHCRADDLSGALRLRTGFLISKVRRSGESPPAVQFPSLHKEGIAP